MSMKRMKHLLVLCLALVMVVGLLSVTALAAGDYLSITAHGQAEPYNVGDTVEVSVTLSEEVQDATGDYSITSNADGWLEAGALQVGGDGRSCSQTFTVTELPKDAQQVTFTVTYTSIDGITLADPKTDALVMSFENPEPVMYEVSFETFGGSEVTTQSVPRNGFAKKPNPDPTLEGCTFSYWMYADGTEFKFNTPITGDLTLYAKWEEDIVYPVPANCYVEANFPSKLLTGTYRDVSISIWEDFGLSWQEDATLYVEVDGPARSDADLWYYDSDAGYWFDGKYVDTVREGKIPDALEFNETGLTIPLSLYLDRAGTYDFTFTLEAGDGTVLATDTATVRAYTETHDDYRIYLDCGRHGSISTTPSTWADYKDTVTIYVKPDKGYELDTLRVYDSDKDRVSVYTNYHDDYVFTMPNSSVTVYATFKEVNYDHFVDVSRDSWYYDAVCYVYDHDIMDGVGSRKFAPYGDLSRAMIVTTLYRMEDEPWVRNYGTFRDVDEDAWYAEAVEWAAEEGIVKGYGKKTFGPNNSVTVEQLAAILQRYADYKGYDIDETVRLYSDAVVSQWALDNVRWAVAEGLLRGGRSVDSTQVATRAEIAYALYNFMMNVAD